jgi:hypothetical protein
MNAPIQRNEVTTKTIHEAVKFALDGKRNESWTAKHQHRAICYLISKITGDDVTAYLTGDESLQPEIHAIKFFGNASANRQTLEKAKVIDATASGTVKRSNLFEGFTA